MFTKNVTVLIIDKRLLVFMGVANYFSPCICMLLTVLCLNACDLALSKSGPVRYLLVSENVKLHV